MGQTSEPAGSLLAGGRLRRAFRRTPPGAPCRAGVCRRPGALRHCPPVVGSAAINASLAAGHPRGMLHGLRPTSPGDARSVGSFQAVKWLSRHILARKRAAVFHGPLDSLPSANTNSLESHDQIPVCWYWGLGRSPPVSRTRRCSSARPSGAVRLEPAQPCQAQRRFHQDRIPRRPQRAQQGPSGPQGSGFQGAEPFGHGQVNKLGEFRLPVYHATIEI